MNLLLEKARAKAAPQLMLDLEFDETRHPRAEAGAQGKYRGGEFVPKEAPAVPVTRALKTPLTYDQTLRIQDLLLMPEFRAMGRFGDLFGSDMSKKTTQFLLANSDHPLAEALRRELNLETVEKPGYRLKRLLTPAITEDDYADIGMWIAQDKRVLVQRCKDENLTRPQREQARADLQGLRAIPYRDGAGAKGIRKLTDWLLAQPGWNDSVDPLLRQIGKNGAKIHTVLAPDQPRKLREGEDAPLGDAAAQWQSLSTRSPYFKRWFGDWENDPEHASKVIDPEDGEPAETWEILLEKAKGERHARAVYHGSGRGGFHVFDFHKTNPNGLVGPGFYFTEDPGVAQSYLQKEGPVWGLSRDLTPEDMGKLREIVSDIEAHNRLVMDGGSPHESIRLRWAEELGQQLDKGQAAVEDFLAANIRADNNPTRSAAVLKVKDDLGVQAVQKGQPTLYSCYLNIRQPWDADRALTAKDLEAIWAHWPADHADKEQSEHEQANGIARRPSWLDAPVSLNTVKLFGDYLDDYAVTDFNRNSRAGFVRALQAMGYDGLTHIGGIYTGHKQHRVWVAWDPAQVKSAQEAAGTFDPRNPDIFKGKRKAAAGLQLVMTFDEEAHPRAAAGAVGTYRGGEFVPRVQAGYPRPGGERLFHDTYTGPRHTYGLHNRPASYGNIPEGWIIDSQREHPDYRHGVVDFPRELTPEEVKSYELEPVIPDDKLGGLTRAQLLGAGRFVAEMEAEGGWSEKEAADLNALGDAYRAGPQALHDFLKSNLVENDFALTLTDNIKLFVPEPEPASVAPVPPAAEPRHLNERDRGVAAEYLSEAMGRLEERGDEPESSLHILRRAFLAGAKSVEALEEFLQIPAVRANPHIARMRELIEAMDPGNSASPVGVAERFGLRAVHFSADLSPNEKQKHLDALSEALSLLSRATSLPENRLGFKSGLGFFIETALGPGVRAAYGPTERAIHINAYQGESLAHEWFHALDDALGREAMGGNWKNLATRSGYAMWNTQASPAVFEALANVMRAIYMECPKFQAAAKEMDRKQFTDGREYWAGMHEMCARAFAGYVTDQWRFMKQPWNTYLLGQQQDYAAFGPDAGMVPPASEMKLLRERFDALFAALRREPALLKALFDKESHPRAAPGAHDPKYKGGRFVPQERGSEAPAGQGSFDFGAEDEDLDDTLAELQEHGETAHLEAQDGQGGAAGPAEGQEEGPRLNRPLTGEEAHAAAHLYGQAREQVEAAGEHGEGADSWLQAHHGLQAAQAGPRELERHLAAAGDEDPHAAVVRAHLGVRGGSEAAVSPRAQAFKAWLGDSKVVEDGEPALVHHGTQSEFDAFDTGHRENTADPSTKLGFFFTESQTVAKRYAGYEQRWEPTRNVDAIAGERHGKRYVDVQDQAERQSIRDEEKASPREVKTYKVPEKARVISGYLSIQKPYEMTNQEFLDRFIHPQLAGEKKAAMLPRVKEFRAKLEAEGYDGIKQLPAQDIQDPTHEYSTVTWIAFKPEQFKAEQNEGTFDAKDTNMFKSVMGVEA